MLFDSNNTASAIFCENCSTKYEPPTTVQKEKEETMTIPVVPAAYSVPEIQSVVHNQDKGSTTINWADGTKTTVHVIEGSAYDKYNGFCAAVMKKLFGTTSMAKRIRDRKDIIAIKAKRAEDQRKREEAAAERRAILERREAKKIAKEIERDRRISRMVDEMIGDDLPY